MKIISIDLAPLVFVPLVLWAWHAGHVNGWLAGLLIGSQFKFKLEFR